MHKERERTLKKYLYVYKERVLIGLKETATYRMNFILSSIITLVSNISFPLISILIYNSGASFSGWTIWEVLLLQSIFTMAIGVSTMLFQNILWITMRNVQDGTLEIFLLKPISCLGFIFSCAFSVDGFVVVLGGLTLFIVSIIKTGGATLLQFIAFFVLFIAGLLVMSGISLFMSAISFKWIANSRIPEIFESMEQFGKYPQTIFPKAITAFTSFVFPVAMIGFFPACSLLGRTKPWMFIAIVPCVLFLIIGIVLYQRMIKLYEGVGG